MPPYGDFHRFDHLFLRRLFFLSVLYHFLRVVADLRIITNKATNDMTNICTKVTVRTKPIKNNRRSVEPTDLKLNA